METVTKRIVEMSLDEILARLREKYDEQRQMDRAIEDAKVGVMKDGGEQYIRYMAVNDDKTRDTHAAASGNIYAIDDPEYRNLLHEYGRRCEARRLSLIEKEAEGLPL